MPGFVDESDEVGGSSFDLIVDVVGKWPTAFAWEAVGANVITTLLSDDGSHCIFNTFVKVASESVGNAEIAGFSFKQVPLEVG